MYSLYILVFHLATALTWNPFYKLNCNPVTSSQLGRQSSNGRDPRVWRRVKAPIGCQKSMAAPLWSTETAWSQTRSHYPRSPIPRNRNQRTYHQNKVHPAAFRNGDGDDIIASSSRVVQPGSSSSSGSLLFSLPTSPFVFPFIWSKRVSCICVFAVFLNATSFPWLWRRWWSSGFGGVVHDH